MVGVWVRLCDGRCIDELIQWWVSGGGNGVAGRCGSPYGTEQIFLLFFVNIFIYHYVLNES